jgi:signal transduction histidine kinase
MLCNTVARRYRGQHGFLGLWLRVFPSVTLRMRRGIRGRSGLVVSLAAARYDAGMEAMFAAALGRAGPFARRLARNVRARPPWSRRCASALCLTVTLILGSDAVLGASAGRPEATRSALAADGETQDSLRPGGATRLLDQRWAQGLAVLLFLGAGPAFYLWRVRRLERQRQAQEAFARRLLDSQETERQRIAGELHDSLGQTLLVIRNLALAGAVQPTDSGAGAARFQEISEVCGGALSEVRSIALALRPVELDRLGLGKSIAAAAQRLGEGAGVRVDVRLDTVDSLLPAGAEIHLYRIVQECLNNVVKHACARSAQVELRRTSAGLELVIADDGCGFTPALEQGTGPGLGLLGVVERARALGGSATIHSRPGSGTRIEVAVPVRQTV